MVAGVTSMQPRMCKNHVHVEELLSGFPLYLDQEYILNYEKLRYRSCTVLEDFVQNFVPYVMHQNQALNTTLKTSKTRA